MKKVLKWGSLGLVVVIMLVVAGVILRLDAIVKRVIETQGSQQMSLQTQLDSASVGLLGGDVELDDLKIANPPGFTATHLFTLDGLDVDTSYGNLRGNPKRVESITLDKPKLVIERGADGRFNFKAAIDQMPKPAPSDPAKQPGGAGEEMKLIIGELTIKDAVVLVRPGINLPGVAQEITVPIPSVSMKNIGNADGAQNGAAMRDVAQQVITVMAANASNSALLPEELRGLLSLDVNAVVAELGNRLGAEAQKRIAAAVPGELGATLSKIAADPNALMKDPNKALEGAVEGVKENVGKTLKDKGITTDVEEIQKDPAKAVEGIRGLFGNKEKKDRKEKGKDAEVAPAEGNGAEAPATE